MVCHLMACGSTCNEARGEHCCDWHQMLSSCKNLSGRFDESACGRQHVSCHSVRWAGLRVFTFRTWHTTASNCWCRVVLKQWSVTLRALKRDGDGARTDRAVVQLIDRNYAVTCRRHLNSLSFLLHCSAPDITDLVARLVGL